MLAARSRHTVPSGPPIVAHSRRFFLATLALTVSMLAGCGDGNAGTRSATGSDSVDVVGVTTYALQARQHAPALVGRTLDGQSLSLESFGKGKVVLLNVWASWCGPCREESPMLGKAAMTFAARGALILGIDEQDSPSDARAFVSSTGMGYPNVVDKDGALLRRLKMLPQMGIPSTLFLDRRGRIAARVIGPVTSSQVTTIVDELVAEG